MDDTKVTPNNDSTTPKNDVVVNSDQPVVATATETHKVETPTATSTTTTTTTVQPQKKSSCLKVGLISCGILLILLIICGLVGFFALGSILRSTSNNGQFNRDDYKTLNPDEIGGSLSFQEKFEAAKLLNPNGEIQITVTEEELLQELARGSDNKDIAKALYLNMKPGSLDIRADLAVLLESLPQEDGQRGFDPKAFDGVFLILEIETSSDGKSLEVKNASVGLPFIDTALGGKTLGRDIEKGLNDGLKEGLSEEGYKIEKIEIKETEMIVTLVPGVASTTTPTQEDNGFLDY